MLRTKYLLTGLKLKKRFIFFPVSCIEKNYGQVHVHFNNFSLDISTLPTPLNIKPCNCFFILKTKQDIEQLREFSDTIYINEQNVRLKILSNTYHILKCVKRNSRTCARYLVFDISAYENAKRFRGILYKIANKYIDVRMKYYKRLKFQQFY